MALYFFDTDDGDVFLDDLTGVEYFDLDAAKVETAKALIELARDVVPGSPKRDVAVIVRDEFGPVHAARMTFEAVALPR